MLYLKVLARAAGQVLFFCIGLWGLEVTSDLEALILAGVLIGTVIFVFALHDAKQLDAARTETAEVKRILRELQKQVVSLVGPNDIPAHLQDLTRLSNEQVKALVANTSAKLREFDLNWRDTFFGRPSLWQRISGWDNLSEADKNEAFQTETAERIREHDAKNADFKKNYRPEALALFEEMKRRLGLSNLTG